MGEEWLASGTQTFGTNGIFRDKWTFSPVYANLLIETADATNDAGDYWVVCFDSTEAGGTTEPDGGAAPKANDFKVVVTGHGASATVQWYKGTGTAWAAAAAPSAAIANLAQSLSATPKIGTPHYVLEMQIDKTDTTAFGMVIMGYNWAQFVGYYDATTATLQQWPPVPASPDVPDGWGYIQYDMAANPTPDVPEGIGLVVMLAVSSVAVAGAVLTRKRIKIANL